MPTNVQVLDLTLSDLYQTGYSTAEPWSNTGGLVTVIPSKGRETLVGWIDKLPSFRRWVGNRVAASANVRTYSIVNDKYELTEFIDRTVVDDNQLGLYAQVFKSIGVHMAKWQDRVIALKIKENPIGFDGVPFFSTAHPVDLDNPGAGTYSNTVAGVDLPTVFQAMIVAAANYVGADGENISFNPTHLLVGTGAKTQASLLLNMQFLPSQAGTATTQNVFQGAAELILAPELNLSAAEQTALGAGKFYVYLLDLSKGISPFVFSLRDAPEFQNLGINGDFDPMTDQYRYGARARGAASVSLPFLAIRGLVG